MEHYCEILLGAPLFSGVEPIVQFWYKALSCYCEIILTLDQLFMWRCCFKDIPYLEICWPLCSVERNHLCNFGRVHHEEHF